MNKYAEMRKRQQQEANALPMKTAVGPEQFNNMMKGWGLNPKSSEDIGEIVPLGFNTYCLKKDYRMVKRTLRSFSMERQAAIAADETGEGFICDMFYEALANHEYSVTLDETDALLALGLSWETIYNDNRFLVGLEKAKKAVIANAIN